MSSARDRVVSIQVKQICATLLHPALGRDVDLCTDGGQCDAAGT